MPRTSRFSPEVRDRAVRMVLEHAMDFAAGAVLQSTVGMSARRLPLEASW